MTEPLRIRVVLKNPCRFWQWRRLILGRNTSWSHRLHFHEDFIATVPWMRFGTNVVVGGASSGKSGIWKAQIDQSIEIREMHYPAVTVAGIRISGATGVVFDGVGRDGILLREPGHEGYIFEREGMYRKGHANIISMTPWFLKSDAYEGDVLFSIPWTELRFDEWEYIFGQMGDAKTWSFHLRQILIRKRRDIRSLEWLAGEFEEKAVNKNYESPVIPRLLPGLAVEAIARALSTIIEMDFLTEPGDPRNYSLTELMEKGWIPVVNFHMNSDVSTKLYTGVLARQIYEFYDAKARKIEALIKWLHITKRYMEAELLSRWTGPFFVFEEFSSIVSKQKLGDPLTPAEKWVEIIIKKGMKDRFELWIILQDMRDVPGEIRRSLGSNRVFIRNPTPEDLQMFEAKISKEAGDIIKELAPYPEDSGAREWVIFDNGVPITFVQVGAMSKLHVR